ncbi:DUF3304 domain-containing protein [Ralstonia sp. 1138]|uniref:DUF3304 domain-containing protein n=1 Tax=Ralstonia sp. 1138 TaxID=3156423 RepID=UPI0033922552
MILLHRLSPWLTVLCLGLVCLSGCAAQEPYTLAIIGYDYTDRAIPEFSVNGAGGGNINLSTPTSGGGGIVCCVVLSRATKTPFWVDVEYQLDELVSYETRKTIEPASPYLTRKVEVTGPIPPDPKYLTVHFYPDGHIEAAIVGRFDSLDPRLKLERRLPFIR